MSAQPRPDELRTPTPVPRPVAQRRALAPEPRASRLSRVLKRAVWVTLLLAAVGGMVWAWLPEPIPVDVARAVRGPLSVSVDQDGRTRVRDRYVLSAPLLGTVARIELEAGSEVRAGQVLVRLLPLESPLLDARTRAQSTARVAAALAGKQQAQTAVSRARAALEFAQAEATRQRELRELGASTENAHERALLEERSSREALASSEFGAQIADYELRMARLALERQSDRGASQEQLELVSPVDGQVLRVLQQSAGVVQPGAPLLELGDLRGLEIVADVLTSEAVQIAPGARATIAHWGGEPPLAAHVRGVEPSAFTRVSALGVEEQRVNVVLDIDAPRATWTKLGDGYRVEVQIEVWSSDRVLTVPAGAVFRDRDRWATFELRAQRAYLVPLELGQRNGERVEIERGLREGASVIVHPSERLIDGARVQAR